MSERHSLKLSQHILSSVGLNIILFPMTFPDNFPLFSRIFIYNPDYIIVNKILGSFHIQRVKKTSHQADPGILISLFFHIKLPYASSVFSLLCYQYYHTKKDTG